MLLAIFWRRLGGLIARSKVLFLVSVPAESETSKLRLLPVAGFDSLADLFAVDVLPEGPLGRRERLVACIESAVLLAVFVLAKGSLVRRERLLNSMLDQHQGSRRMRAVDLMCARFSRNAFRLEAQV